MSRLRLDSTQQQGVRLELTVQERLLIAKLDNRVMLLVSQNPRLTSMHTLRVAWLGVRIAVILGLQESDCEKVRDGAVFHDAGKAHELAQEWLLQHHGKKASKEEKAYFTRLHSRLGKVMLPQVDRTDLTTSLEELEEICLLHHAAAKDLKGPLAPVINVVKVADEFDAITCGEEERAYNKKRRSEEAVMRYLYFKACKELLDSACVDALHECRLMIGN